jgi:hypothetical protein
MRRGPPLMCVNAYPWICYALIMKGIQALLSTCVALAAWHPTQAWALSCAAPKVDEAFDRADTVFEGTLTKKNDEGDGFVMLTFDVDQLWKGEPADEEVRVRALFFPRDPHQKTPVIGEDWIVFAAFEGDMLEISLSLCSPSGPASARMRDELDQLTGGSGCFVGSKSPPPPFLLLVPVVAWLRSPRCRRASSCGGR